ncbi:MAG TPA: SpoIIE family protein phosphatase, partial [Ilumatobacteraceae bacterium]
MTTIKRARRLPIVIVIVGVLVFAGFSAACRGLYNQTENRLLQQRTTEAASVLQVSVSQIRTPLDAAATLADETKGDPAAFQSAMRDVVGATLSFTSAALFRIGDPTPISTIGADSALMAQPGGVTAMEAATSTQPFAVVDLLAVQPRRLGYAVADGNKPATYVVYGERTLSTNPNARRRTDEPFAQLDYAIYLGHDESASHLLGASTTSLPITGRRAAAEVPFGTSQLRLVMTPIGHLSSDLFADLWWIVAIVGILTTLGFAALARRLLVRRDAAEALAVDNQRLYDEQRGIAETLQLSLLPQYLDTPDDIQVAARYWPAGSANLIGGDFYDAFRVDAQRWGLTIGDICGKGIEAATLTGVARHTVRAAARTST